ncbi:MAG: GlsB/YeaQ/YmgE family stress response membrane protein [Candidatus Dormibacteria bacterium]
MNSHHLLAWLLIGLIAGALAGRVVRGKGFGCFGDIVVGLIGAVIGGFVLNRVTGGGDASSSFIIECIVAFVGAVILVFILRLFSRGGSRGGRGRGGAYR